MNSLVFETGASTPPGGFVTHVFRKIHYRVWVSRVFIIGARILGDYMTPTAFLLVSAQLYVTNGIFGRVTVDESINGTPDYKIKLTLIDR